MTSTPEFGQDQNAEQTIQAAVPLTRAQRLATYTPKVRKLRVSILSVGLCSIAAWLATVLLINSYVTPCLHMSHSCTINSASDVILGGLFILLVMPALVFASLALSVALLVLGIVLIVERNRSQGTWPAIVAIGIGALLPLVTLATIADPLVTLATIENLMQNQTY